MEVELKTIIDKIKQEGVDEAEKKAKEIILKAEAKAKSILDDAVREKEAMIKQAGLNSEKLKSNGEEALKHASRDVLLGLRESIIALIDGVIKSKVTGQLSADVLKEMIVRIVENAAQKDQFDLEVLLTEQDKKYLEQGLLDSLKKEFSKGLELKISPHLKHGFRIGKKGGNAYYDFTDEAISEAFRSYLNPKIADLLS